MRSEQALAAYREFLAGNRRELDPVAFFHEVVASVPGYRDFLADANVDPAAVRDLAGFRRLPMTTKDTYHRRHATDLAPDLPQRQAFRAQPSGQLALLHRQMRPHRHLPRSNRRVPVDSPRPLR